MIVTQYRYPATWRLPIAFLVSVLVAGPMTGCERSGEPMGNVSDSLLAEVLADLHQLEAGKQLVASEDSLLLESEAVLSARFGTRDSILTLHGLSENSFTAAMKPFIDEPARYVALYDRVLDNLMERARTPLSREE